MNRIADIAIPSPRNPNQQTTAVAEVVRGRLIASSSTCELHARLAKVRG